MIQIDIFVVLAQLINFGIIFYLFKRYIAEKLYASILERKELLKKLEMADEHYAEKMNLADEQKEKLLKQARKTSSNLVKESEKIAKEKADAIMQQANMQAMAILDGWKRELEQERLTMLAEMKKHIVDVSLKLNEKMFGTKGSSKKFIEEELKRMK